MDVLKHPGKLSFRETEDVSVMEVQLCSDKQRHKSGVVPSRVWCLPMAALRDLHRLQVKNNFSNTWPSAGDPSCVLSFFCFARPEGHLLGTNGYSRVLVLHPCRVLVGTHQPRLLSQMTLPSNDCVTWLWEVHARKCPRSIKDHPMAALFSVLSLLTAPWRQSSSESCLSKARSHWTLQNPELWQIQHHLSLDIVWWPVTLCCNSHRSGQLLFTIINELTNINSTLGLIWWAVWVIRLYWLVNEPWKSKQSDFLLAFQWDGPYKCGIWVFLIMNLSLVIFDSH